MSVWFLKNQWSGKQLIYEKSTHTVKCQGNMGRITVSQSKLKDKNIRVQYVEINLFAVTCKH